MGRKLGNFLKLLLCLFVALVAAFLMFRNYYRTVIRELAQSQVKTTTSDMINDAIAKQVAQGSIQYDRLVYFEKDLALLRRAVENDEVEVTRSVFARAADARRRIAPHLPKKRS